MNKEFIPYEQAHALKELGFNEPCFGWFRSTLIPSNFTEYFLETEFDMNESPSDWVNSNFLGKMCSAPLYQQAFRWFRENYQMVFCYEPCLQKDLTYTFFIYMETTGEKVFVVESEYNEEAELACLIKLIEITRP